ncbi:hypothetical protein Clacol_003274 [Clathrus columnatus]|uniref:Uncharacterized protein n=1 Tax=Clathrus columnatus TaxID=1419009 RepID=A0AAV5A5X0_9AGAM|nr:hypothetical protein Clacol_003274 [Clathrus columnatus]
MATSAYKDDLSDWLFQESTRTYERTGTYSYGVTFKTRQIPREVVVARAKEAVGRFRFRAPIVACSRKIDQELPLQQSFVYKPALNAEEALAWAATSLTIETVKGVTLEKYLAEQAEKAFPYIHPNGLEQFFGCFLLCHDQEDVYSFVARIAHGFVDGRPWLNFLRFVLDTIASPDKEKEVRQLEWGSEWSNLPDSPATLARRNVKRQSSHNYNGNYDLVWEEGWRELQTKLQKVFNRMELGESLKPPKPEATGKRPMARATHQIDAATINLIKSELKMLGHSMAILVPAVHILTVFQRSQPLKPESYITLDLTMIDTSRFFPPEYSGPLIASSRTGFAPLTVEAKEIVWNASTREQLICIMKNLEKQVQDYLQYPQLTLINTVGPTESSVAPMHPHTCILSYIGVIDLILPSTIISKESGDVELEVLDFGVTHRHAGGFQRPSNILWCFRGKFNIMIQVNICPLLSM